MKINPIEGYADVGVEILSTGEVIFHNLKSNDPENMAKFLRAVADNIEKIKDDV